MATIVFVVGNVILPFDPMIACRKLAADLRVIIPVPVAVQIARLILQLAGKAMLDEKGLTYSAISSSDSMCSLLYFSYEVNEAKPPQLKIAVIMYTVTFTNVGTDHQ